MSNYTVVIVAKADYEKLSPETKKLFDKDIAKLKRSPHNPQGMRAIRVGAREPNFLEAHAAAGRVMIRYRIIVNKVEVRVINIVDPNLR